MTGGSTAHAQVLSVTTTAMTRLVTIRCPLCGRRHLHGWPYTLATIGVRVRHCVHLHVPPGAPASYRITTPEQVSTTSTGRRQADD